MKIHLVRSVRLRINRKYWRRFSLLLMVLSITWSVVEESTTDIIMYIVAWKHVFLIVYELRSVYFLILKLLKYIFSDITGETWRNDCVKIVTTIVRLQRVKSSQCELNDTSTCVSLIMFMSSVLIYRRNIEHINK